MHRIPRFFNHSTDNHRKGGGAVDPKQLRRKPRLERQNALRNVDYEPTTSSYSSEESEHSPALRTRSLDIPPLNDRKSFRFVGAHGEMELLCRSLGLSGPEDFGIPKAAWEARKVRSSFDLLPRSRLNNLDSPNVETLAQQVEADRFGDSVRVSDFGEDRIDSVHLYSRFTAGGRDRIEEVSVLSLNSSKPIEIYNSGGCSGRGIKGVRPPALAPPPAIPLPFVDNSGSTWDLMKSVALDADRGCAFQNRECFSYLDDEGADAGREQANETREGVVLSDSCSFTTSNDDDSSSTTTDRTSNVSPNGKFKRFITYWEKGELIGRGSFGSVYEGIADGGFFIAVKEVSLLDQGELGRQSIYQLEQEIDLLSKFEHENIVQYYGTDKDESTLYIFLELVTKGSLLSLYQKYHLRDPQVSGYTRQILHGLKYLHDRNVVHRDIKCANILVDANGSVKLADFGLAKATKLNDVKSCKGTVFWMAPEVVNGRNQGYGLPADIWSLGCSVLEMLTQQLPYYPLEFMQALFEIGQKSPPPVPDSLSTDARDFIHQCLQVDPDARPTAAQLLDHPFVKRPLPSSLGAMSPLNPGRRVLNSHVL